MESEDNQSINNSALVDLIGKFVVVTLVGATHRVALGEAGLAPTNTVTDLAIRPSNYEFTGFTEVSNMGWKDKVGKFFQTKDGEIQKAYQSYDRASDLLGARDKNPDNFTRTKELDEAVKEAEKLSLGLLENYEGTKSWPGIFREMHMNLVRLWLKTERYDEALKGCDKIAEYNPLDAEELREAVEEAKSGKKLEATQLDEIGVA